MTRASLFLSVAMLWIVAPLAAQNNNAFGPQTVFVRLMPGTPRVIEVGPRAVAMCKGSKGCSSYFKVKWIGTPGEEGERIKIEFTTSGTGDCLDKTEFELAPQGEETVTVKTDNSLCDAKGKTAFFFDVSCVGGDGGNCGGVETIDPGAMVDGGSG